MDTHAFYLVLDQNETTVCQLTVWKLGKVSTFGDLGISPELPNTAPRKTPLLYKICTIFATFLNS